MDWKKEFLKLYVSEELEDYQKACDLKNAHIPNKLYRYRSLSDASINTTRFGEIVRGELYLSHPDELNDPLEASSLLHTTDATMYSAQKDEYMKAFSGKMPTNIFEEIFDDENWFDKLTTYVAEKTVPTEKIPETKDALRKTILYAFEELNAHLTKVSRSLVRIACFTSKGNNLPMWSHYANNHKGICLEYNSDEIRNVYQRNKLFPVSYVDILPDVTYMMLNKTQPRFSLFDYIALHKFADWNYEDEWRLIHDAGSWYYGPEDVPKEYWNKGKVIQFIKPSRIILGINIIEAHEERMREIAEIAGVPVTKAKLTQYGLDIK